MADNTNEPLYMGVDLAVTSANSTLTVNGTTYQTTVTLQPVDCGCDGATVAESGTKIDAACIDCEEICAVSEEDDDHDKHPNEMPFTGTLVILDEPSDKPPHGADGHRILVPSNVAKKRLDTLLNMAINYTKELNSHAPRHKVGVITGAWIDGNKLKVKGVIWKKDFPEAAKDLRRGALGMSMELANVWVQDKDASVWRLDDLFFTGATVLYKRAAAYSKTALAAVAAAALGFGGTTEMPENDVKQNAQSDVDAMAKTIAAAIGSAVTEAMKPVTEKLETIAASIEDVKVASVAAATAAAQPEKEEVQAEAEEVEEVEAGCGDEEEMEDEEEFEDEEEIEAELAKLEPKPAVEKELGELNKDAENKGHKTSVSAGADAAQRIIEKLQAANAQLKAKYNTVKAENKQMSARLDEIEAQLDVHAASVERRTISAEAANLLERGGHSIDDIRAEGRVLSVSQVDHVLDNCQIALSATDRMRFKNELLAAGVMERGEVARPLFGGR